MDINALQSFFDLGNSTRRDNNETIGEKGHGTKVYLNSSKIEVITICNEKKFTAVMDSPIRQLHKHITPDVIVTTEETMKKWYFDYNNRHNNKQKR